MTGYPERIAKVREGLYAAGKGIGFQGESLAPVPGHPIGDAHLALAALEALLADATRALEGWNDYYGRGNWLLDERKAELLDATRTVLGRLNGESA